MKIIYKSLVLLFLTISLARADYEISFYPFNHIGEPEVYTTQTYHFLDGNTISFTDTGGRKIILNGTWKIIEK